jgi:hypothetical protein
MMNLHLAEISILVAPGARAALVCDGGNWHQCGNAPTMSSCYPGRPTVAQMLATGIPEDSVLAKVKKDGVLRIGFDQTAPWFFKDLKANALSGIYYDLCELLARFGRRAGPRQEGAAFRHRRQRRHPDGQTQPELGGTGRCGAPLR